MFKFIFVFCSIATLALSGCATSEKSILLGSGVGIAAGAGVGALATMQGDGSQQLTGALIGAIVGEIAGGLIGHETYKHNEKNELPKGYDLNSAHVDMFGNAAPSSGKPRLSPAKVRVRYVEDQVKDGTFTPAHLEYDISEGAHWEGAK